MGLNMEYKMNENGQNIIADLANEKRANEILQILDSNDSVDLDFLGIQIATTFAIRQILRPIVEKYGFSELFRKVAFLHVQPDTKIVIATAIERLRQDYDSN